MLNRKVSQGPVSIDVDFGGNKASGTMTVNESPTEIAVDLGGMMFADGAGAGEVMGALPLAEGYKAIYRNFDMQAQKEKLMQVEVAGVEEVTVEAGTFKAWRLDITSAEGDPDKRSPVDRPGLAQGGEDHRGAAADGRRRPDRRAGAVNARPGEGRLRGRALPGYNVLQIAIRHSAYDEQSRGAPMKTTVIAGLLAVSIGACETSRAPVTAPQNPRTEQPVPVADAPIVRSILRSLDYLEEEGDRWMKGEAWVQDGTGCVSCHHVAFALWSHREAEAAGVERDAAGIDDLRRRAVEFQSDLSEVVPSMELILAGAHTDHDVEVLRSHAEPDGSWRAKGQFPRQRRGEAEGDAVATLWALVALRAVEAGSRTGRGDRGPAGAGADVACRRGARRQQRVDRDAAGRRRESRGRSGLRRRTDRGCWSHSWRTAAGVGSMVIPATRTPPGRRSTRWPPPGALAAKRPCGAVWPICCASSRPTARG